MRMAVAVAGLAGILAVAAEAADPFAAYGRSHAFDIRRDGATIGREEIDFTSDAGSIRVSVRLDIAVKILFFTAYRFAYRAESVWDAGGDLVRFRAETDDDGEMKTVDAATVDGGIRVVGTAGTAVVPKPVFPAEHWHPGVLAARRVFDTESGRIKAIAPEALGETVVETTTDTIPARRYRYGGDVDDEIWFDARNRWVALRLTARDGSVIEYVCRTCGP